MDIVDLLHDTKIERDISEQLYLLGHLDEDINCQSRSFIKRLKQNSECIDILLNIVMNLKATHAIYSRDLAGTNGEVSDNEN